MRRPIRPFVVLAALLAAAPLPTLAADRFAGTAQVVDGDSLVIDGRDLRLFGLDAPEWDQTCTGDPAQPGAAATAWLRSVVAGRIVACHREDTDRYGRPVVTCFVDGADLNERIVRAGWAVAYTRYSDRYVAAEADAKAAGRGLWAAQCDTPEAWRHAR